MVPAPFWFVEFFKVVGFVLHTIPMGIWFAGLPVTILCALWGCKNSQFYANRMFQQFPIFIALGINFGIVPLLFLQTTYYQSFYTATILTAWHWIAIIPILIIGYYSLYLAAYSGEHRGQQIGFGILASICLIGIGILITNGLTLLVRSDLWQGIMERTNYYGATTGVANNMHDPALWIRLATMFGLGLITVAVWSVLDSHLLLGKNADSAYQIWTKKLAIILSVLGATVLTGTEWAVKTGQGGEALKTAYPYFGVILLLAYLVFIALLLAGKFSQFVFIAALLQVLTLAGFGIIRQIGQNAGVAQLVDVSKIPAAVQWSPLVAFLLIFILGVALIVWMVRQIVILPSEK